jgi:hypothetical protein
MGRFAVTNGLAKFLWDNGDSHANVLAARSAQQQQAATCNMALRPSSKASSQLAIAILQIY